MRPAGRFLVGTLALDGRAGQESLFQWDLDGALILMDSDLTLANGLAWLPDGTLFYSTDTVRVPAPHVSSVAFVAEGLDPLLITTASRDLSPEQVAESPGAGCLFVADVGVTGIRTAPWVSSAMAGCRERVGS